MEVRQVYISKEQSEINTGFTGLYEPLGYQGTVTPNRGESKRAKLLTKRCRFCNGDREKTTFKQDTHLISNLLGQNTFFSVDECDKCNQSFKNAESDLASYLGIARTTGHLRRDAKAPTFESAKGGVKVRNLGNGFLWVTNEKSGNGEFNADMQNGTVNISFESQKFKPENVYRALLKMALGNLPADEIDHYRAAIDFLMNMENIDGFQRLKRVIITETDIVLHRPFALLFQKRNGASDDNLPRHIFCLYWQNLMFQIDIPGYDEYPLEKHFIQTAIAPYVQFNVEHPHDDIIASRSTAILYSKEPSTNGENLTMEFSVENLVAIPMGPDFGEWLKQLSK